ncbi:MAG: hypothetical protein GF408_05130 [Candidatus Omnitrophica bacterium]|nr:hypothetical protein [Candidatus Omnitrophota bacterium]
MRRRTDAYSGARDIESEDMRELRIIDHMEQLSGKNPEGVVEGIGDDAAVIDPGGKEYLLWAQDMIADGTHFRAGRDAYASIGRKAVAVNISDIAAMGGIPRYISVSLGIPSGTGSRAVKAICGGITDTCAEHGMKVLGGDTVRCSRLVIDISIIGSVAKNGLRRRSGASAGEAVIITGPVRNGRKRHLDPRPRLEESIFLSGRKVTSMIDVSDGIGPDLIRVCRASGTGCRLYTENIPLEKGLSLEDALYYGESFELMFTMNKKDADEIVRNKAPYGFYLIGEMTDSVNRYEMTRNGTVSGNLEFRGFEH